MIYNTLGKTGLQVSQMGFGCAPLGNEYGELDHREAIRSVHAAIDGGINFFWLFDKLWGNQLKRRFSWSSVRLNASPPLGGKRTELHLNPIITQRSEFSKWRRASLSASTFG